MSFLGLDVGTTGCKVVAFREGSGEQIVSGYREYPLLSPHPGWGELNPNTVWDAVRECLREVASRLRHDPPQALGISSQGEACVPVSSDGEVLGNAAVSFDARTMAYPDWWRARIADAEVMNITGQPMHTMYSAHKIRWWLDQHPDVFRRVWKFLCFEDFVQFRLGVPPTMSYPLAGRTMLFDRRTGAWSARLLEVAGLEPAMLSAVAPSGTAVDVIPERVADDLGLPRGVVVATGAHDQIASAVGAGATSNGSSVNTTGTVECVTVAFQNEPDLERLRSSNLCLYHHGEPGLWCSLAFNFTGGVLFRWYRDQFGSFEMHEARADGRDAYDALLEHAPAAPTRLLVLPHFTSTGTPYFDAQARGAIVGLQLSTTKPEVTKAVLEGITFELRLNLELLEASGVAVNELRAVGGAAKSDLWMQLKADLTGKTVVRLSTSETPSLGVARLAARSVGAQLEPACAVRTFEPRAAHARAYDEQFMIYRDLYGALRGINHRLAR